MPVLQLSPDDGLFYEWERPADENGVTFVFVNAITGDLGMWEAEIAPALRAQGHGSLGYNFRGQASSPFRPGTALDEALIVDDLRQLLDRLQPERPVLVGLSIGGLYAAKAVLAGSHASGLVLINTLRRIGPRIDWMNAATLRAVEVGGPQLVRDLFSHLLNGEAWQAANRQDFLRDDADYTPLDRDSGPYNLLTWMGATDWDIDWAALDLPVLSLTGLNDRVFYEPADVAELFALLPRGRRIDVAEAGHMLPIESPGRLIEALGGFADGLENNS